MMANHQSKKRNLLIGDLVVLGFDNPENDISDYIGADQLKTFNSIGIVLKRLTHDKTTYSKWVLVYWHSRKISKWHSCDEITNINDI